MKNYFVKSFIPTQTFPAIPLPDNALRVALLYQLEHSQWWKEADIKKTQYDQIKKILDHAYQTVPYYRALWNEKKISIPAKIDDTFFSTLPILRREDIQNANEGLVSTQLPHGHGKISFGTTSGSTGRPVRFGRTPVTTQFWYAFALRENLWHQRDFSKKLCTIRTHPGGLGMPPEGASGPNWGEVVEPIFQSGPSCFLNILAKLSEQYAWLQREKPDYLISHPSNFSALAEYIISHKLEFPKLQQLRTMGETLSPQVREYLARSWNTDVVDMYTCEEAGYLAVECPDADHFHVQSENVLLEIVDEANQPCPIGVPGRVLITSLNNFATPLIRYELGDYAEFGPPCKCGRGLPVIQRVLGRHFNRLFIPTESGTQSVFPCLGRHDLTATELDINIRQFQCVQHSLKLVEFKLVMDCKMTAEQEEKAVKLMQTVLGHPFEIKFTYLSEIPRGSNGKFQEFISLVSP